VSDEAQKEVLFDVRGQCVVITINRPAQRNAMNIAACEQLADAFRRFDEDSALRVAILTGAGDKAFSAGRDVKEAAGLHGARVPPLPQLGVNIEVSKPVIAAVNGAALGGGWVFAQMCDLCIAVDTATFAITEGKFGRGFAWAAPLIHMIGSRLAMELILTGKTIDAQRAYEMGFVNKVVASADLLPQALAMAEEIIACAPLSVAMARQMVKHATNMGVDAACKVGKQLNDSLYHSEDVEEGARAFKEKRKPVWKGR
jgi:enoyl-CoA hydratase